MTRIETEELSQSRHFTLKQFIDNFPFEHIRAKQLDVLKQICDAFNNGYRTIILEAPTGFGKSPVAVSIGGTLGSSYICSATKDLQAQYARDFQFIQTVKGMSEFSCLVKEDLVSSELFECSICGSNSKSMTECSHITTVYGSCRQDRQGYTHDYEECKKGKCGGVTGFHSGCRYRTFVEDYHNIVEVKNEESDNNDNKVKKTSTTMCELIPKRAQEYLEYRTDNAKTLTGWLHLANLTTPALEHRKEKFTPCPYYDQLNKGRVAPHSIFNYANFQLFLRIPPNSINGLPQKQLLVLDEGHQIETQIVSNTSISISKRTIQQFISTYALENVPYGYDDSMEEKWIPFLGDLAKQIADAVPTMKSAEIAQNAKDYVAKLEDTIADIKLDYTNWIVSDIVLDNNKSNKDKNNSSNRTVIKLEFKPLDVSRYCRKLFEKCPYNLIMSATILDVDTFCRNIGLDPQKDRIKFISVDSDFPPENRSVYPVNITYLNKDSLQVENVKQALAKAVDRIMDEYADTKGIIHTTSYAQLEFIEKYLSRKNKRRLIPTVSTSAMEHSGGSRRTQIIAEHFASTKPTVLISPSLHTGLDLKDDYARFQILVKVPFPNTSDKWTDAKRKRSPQWYNWQTALRLVQTCGRSVRSQTDYADTYVLDSTFSSFVQRNRLPNWFKQAIYYSSATNAINQLISELRRLNISMRSRDNFSSYR